MKSEKEIESERSKLILSVREMASKHGFPLVGLHVTTEQLYYIAMGALATTSFVLERESQTNFCQLIAALEVESKKVKRVKKAKRPKGSTVVQRDGDELSGVE